MRQGTNSYVNQTKLCPDCNEKDDLKKDFYSTLQAETNIRGLKVAHCCGLFWQLTEIKLILQESKIDILGITETHLSDKIKDEEIRIDGYTVQRLDRSRRGLPNKLSGRLKCYTKAKARSKIGGSYLDWSHLSITEIINRNRPPKDKDFYDTFKNILDMIYGQNEIISCWSRISILI